MSQSKVSLSWDAYKGNVCGGLSALQQSGEFVDMTLAADGHFVKVHQVIVALASPYIKEIISSIQCPHPVVFLNKISYTTLSLILEYIYTGEVMVSLDNLTELLVAGRELHIKGLEDMKIHDGLTVKRPLESENEAQDEICYFEVSNDHQSIEENSVNNTILGDTLSYGNPKHMEENEGEALEDLQYMQVVEDTDTYSEVSQPVAADKPNSKQIKMDPTVKIMQYTVSNQGSLQMILNRFVYYLKHSNRDNSRQWRCVDYLSHVKCPAYVITKDDIVLQRISAHVHPFHDAKILKKVRQGSVFSALQDAEREGSVLKNKGESGDKLLNKNKLS